MNIDNITGKYFSDSEVTCEWPYIPSNENGDCETMKMLLNSFACYEQSDWPKKVIIGFIISLYVQ